MLRLLGIYQISRDPMSNGVLHVILNISTSKSKSTNLDKALFWDISLTKCLDKFLIGRDVMGWSGVENTWLLATFLAPIRSLWILVRPTKLATNGKSDETPRHRDNKSAMLSAHSGERKEWTPQTRLAWARLLVHAYPCWSLYLPN
jgi:hypothetical protein